MPVAKQNKPKTAKDALNRIAALRKAKKGRGFIKDALKKDQDSYDALMARHNKKSLRGQDREAVVWLLAA